ncbi:MAG: diaminopimelate decarboxylase [Candidatus Lumbricidophila eiseniae]|uniref:Diaminopimelate decarboxylase n=1 Tax=Candidatus Lumbricidiphila eiseniae TaxID=1969409 RepID=A0A2A6FTE5_9MICO|nr:MAG: diaminopimelate decarboxylase [Candidatus Lumbricidophila eiseniae]
MYSSLADSVPLPSLLPVPADANALSPAIWPASVTRTADGHLVIGGVDVVTLARDYGTPLYVVDEGEARARARALRDVFTAAAASIGTTVTVYYAGKALLTGAVVSWMLAEGLNIDVCSPGELRLALAAGAAAARLGYHGNNKSVREIRDAVRAGVGVIVLDSEIEIDRVAEAAASVGRRQAVRLRVNSGVHASTHEFLATAHEDQKFGVPLERAVELGERIRNYPSLELLGLHCHTGSQIFDARGFAVSAERLIRAHAALAATAPLPELNLGGGFGIAYSAEDDPAPITDTVQGIMSAVAAACAAYGTLVPRLAFEPGRWIIGPAGVTLYTVGTVKPVPIPGGTRHYVSIDGGMSDNVRPALYGACYCVRLASRVSTAVPTLVRVVGSHCEAGDIVVDADYLPGDITPGDLVAVPATGAYCWSLGSNYNYFLRPAVVAVSAGTARLMVRRETYGDLYTRDADLSAQPWEDSHD